MRRKPEILRSQTVAATRLFRIEAVDLRFSNGVEAQFERLMGAGRGAVLVVPVLGDDELLLVREYAVGTERYELGFPRGKVEGDESPHSCAQRELREELGYGAGRLETLKSVSLSPGYANYRTHIILATGLYPDSLEGDEPEALEAVRWPLTHAAALLSESDFSDARCMLAVYLLREALARGSS